MSSYSLPPELWQLVAKNLDVEDLCCFRCAGRLFAATGLLQLRTYYGGTLDNASINCSPETLRSMLAVLGNTGLVKNVHRFGMSIVDLTPDQQLLKHVRLENLRKLVLRAVTLESSGALVLLLKQHARTLVELEMSAVTLSTSRQGPLCFGDTPCSKVFTHLRGGIPALRVLTRCAC